MAKHVPYLDGWRGLAILCLLLGHFFPVPGINFGTVGVALFFVLSGLLMAEVLFVRRTGLATFYRRRFARVFPSVAVYISVVTTIFILSERALAPVELLSAVTFTNNYFLTDGRWTMPLGHIWSLSVEEHSYVILSIAALWCRSRGGNSFAAVGAILVATLVAVAIYSFVPAASTPSFQLRTEVASFGIFASSLLLLLAVFKHVRFTRYWLAPVALITGVVCHWWRVPAAAQIVLGWGALALSINAMPTASITVRRFFEMQWLRKLGLYSFSIYLWQQPYYQLHHHFGMSSWSALSLALITGFVAYHTIENPARQYLNRHWGTKPLAVVAEENGEREVQS